jgi:ribosomal protein L37E
MDGPVAKVDNTDYEMLARTLITCPRCGNKELESIGMHSISKMGKYTLKYESECNRC